MTITRGPAAARPRRRRAVPILAAAAAAVALAGAVSGLGPGNAGASSHREAPLTAMDPAADNTDLYAFVSPERPGFVTFIANWIPFEEPNGGPNFYPFATDATYLINVDSDGDAKPDARFRFTFQNIDNRGGSTWSVFAGQADDPFFLDLRVFDLLYGGDLSETGQDTLAGYNVNTIALQVPFADVAVGGDAERNPVIGIWTTTERSRVRVNDDASQNSDRVQVSRLGNPLVNEVVVPASLKDGVLTTVAGLAGEAVLGWLGVVSGGLVAAVGLGMLLGARRLRGHHHGHETRSPPRPGPRPRPQSPSGPARHRRDRGGRRPGTEPVRAGGPARRDRAGSDRVRRPAGARVRAGHGRHADRGRVAADPGPGPAGRAAGVPPPAGRRWPGGCPPPPRTPPPAWSCWSGWDLPVGQWPGSAR